MTTRFVNYLAAGMFAVVGLLIVAHFCVLPLDSSDPVRILFDLQREGNIPTWFASCLWLLAALYAVIAYRQDDECGWWKPAYNRIWILIAVGFAFASLDDVAGIHEKMGDYKRVLSATFSVALPVWTRNWVIIYAPIIAVFSIIGGTFLWRRFRGFTTAKLLLVVAAICYGTALGSEACQKNKHLQAQLRSGDQLMMMSARWRSVVEESLEDIGTACMVLALAQYVSLSRQRRLVRLESPSVSDVSCVNSVSLL